MEIGRAFQTARREWDNIRLSLEACGDIGEFDSKDFAGGGSECLALFRNLNEMENKFAKHGYFTPEAAYVFSALASIAAEKLGLTDSPAQIFGSGYSWVRTGCFNLNCCFDLNYKEGQERLGKQLFFFKLFFPIGGDFNWDFNSPAAKAKIGLVFGKFIGWQDDPNSYSHDVRNYKAQLKPLLRGLSVSLGFPVDDSENYEAEDWDRLRV